MCNNACIDFVAATLTPPEAFNKEVIESGARDVNGSVRPIFERYGAKLYVGTDIVPGPRVDQLCDAVDLVKTFGARSFDVLVSTEILEHVRDWRAVISNYKRILRPGGLIFITTRSVGFPYHEYPEDHWRYEVEDMQAIFADFEIVTLQGDPSEPGVFIKARRPKRLKEKDLSAYELYSIIKQARSL